jgi:hypothetical protein
MGHGTGPGRALWRYTWRMKRKPNKLLLCGLVAVQVVSAVLAWRDLAGRSDDQVRGKKKTWRLFMLLNPGNSFVYWVVGRR